MTDKNSNHSSLQNPDNAVNITAKEAIDKPDNLTKTVSDLSDLDEAIEVVNNE